MNKVLKNTSLLVVLVLSLLFLICSYFGIANISNLINSLSNETYKLPASIKLIEVFAIIIAVLISVTFIAVLVVIMCDFGNVNKKRCVTIVCMIISIISILLIGFFLFGLNLKFFSLFDSSIGDETITSTTLSLLSSVYISVYDQLFYACLGCIVLCGLNLWFNPEEYDDEDVQAVVEKTPEILANNADEQTKMQYKQEIEKMKNQLEIQKLKDEYEDLRNQLKK